MVSARGCRYSRNEVATRSLQVGSGESATPAESVEFVSSWVATTVPPLVDLHASARNGPPSDPSGRPAHCVVFFMRYAFFMQSHLHKRLNDRASPKPKRVRALVRLLRRMRLRLLLLRARSSGRRSAVCVVLHRVDAPASPPGTRLDPALAPAAFRRQLRGLARHFKLVHASMLCSAAAERRRGGRIPVALTFDDDLGSHLDVVAPILLDAGVPASFFLTGATLHAPFCFWWQRFDRALERGLALDDPRLPAIDGTKPLGARWTEVDAMGDAIRRLAPSRRDEVADALLEVAGPDPPDAGLRADQVEKLARAGFEIGFHTRRHDSLTRLDDEALRRAMRDGRQELERVVGRPLTAIAYPHGDADDRVARFAADAGFAAGFTTAATAIAADGDAFRQARIDAVRLPWPDLGFALVRMWLRAPR